MHRRAEVGIFRNYEGSLTPSLHFQSCEHRVLYDSYVKIRVLECARWFLCRTERSVWRSERSLWVVSFVLPPLPHYFISPPSLAGSHQVNLGKICPVNTAGSNHTNLSMYLWLRWPGWVISLTLFIPATQAHPFQGTLPPLPHYFIMISSQLDLLVSLCYSITHAYAVG